MTSLIAVTTVTSAGPEQVAALGPGAVSPLALVAVAGALLLVGGPAAGRRLRTLTGPGAPDDGHDQPVLRPAWLAVAAVALGAVGWALGGGVPGILVGVAVAVAGGWALRRAATGGHDTDAAALAGAWELLAVCLQAGLPVASAASAAAAPLAGDAGRSLRRVAGLLELGAEPASAWRSAARRPELAGFARAAARSAGTGAALAQVALAESARIRARILDDAEARAQRAAVHVTGPLGLCFLPAFLVLGIAPVVIGLAGDALARW